jgi:SSS family solute:Na+ symporter
MNTLTKILICLVLLPRCKLILADATPTTQPTQAQAIDVLKDVMQHEDRFVKIHAAEALIELGESQLVQATFMAEERLHREEPSYRIGIWRVLARTNNGTPERDVWIDRVRAVALDAAAQDRISAVESLAKLKYTLKPEDRPAIEALANGADDGIALFATWLLFQTPRSENPQDHVAQYLDSKDPITRLRAIYILRFLPDLSDANRGRLKAAAQAEPKGTPTYAYATSSSFIVARAYGDADESLRARSELYRMIKSGSDAEKEEACQALGVQGSAEDLAAIAPLMTSAAPGARVGAALATARIVRREAQKRAQRQSRRPDVRAIRPATVG